MAGRWLRITLILVALIVAYFLVPIGRQLDESLLERGAVSLLLIAASAALLLWQVVLLVGDPDRRVDGLIIAIVVGVLAFALAFFRLEIEDPGQIAGLSTRVDALYFTMTTLLTVGYGDIHAVGQTAKVLVLLQMLFNVIVLATGVSTLTRRVRDRAARRAEERHLHDDEPRSARHHPRRTHRKPT